MTSVRASSAAPSAEATMFQSHGAVLVADLETLTVSHAAGPCAEVLGAVPHDIVGRPLEDWLSGEDLRALEGRLAVASGSARWQVMTLNDGRLVKSYVFEPGTGSVGLDLTPTDDSPERSSLEAVLRIASWSERVMLAQDPVELLTRACEAVVALTGYDGTWACKIEPDGHGLIVAAAVSGSTAEVLGQRVLPADFAPSDPWRLGRPSPFFVGDLTAAAAELDPVAPASMDFQGSTLWRPYGTYLQRLVDIGVRATFSIPVVIEGETWCRLLGQNAEPLEVSVGKQAELGLLGASVSSRLAELLRSRDTQERLDLAMQSTRVLKAIGTRRSLADGLAADPTALLRLCEAAGALVAVDGALVSVGHAPHDGEAELLLASARRLLGRETSAAVVTTTVAEPTLDEVGGYLAARLGDTVDDLIVWTRPTERTVETWVEHQTVGRDRPDELFHEMGSRTEATDGCRPWSVAQVQAVGEFRAALGSLLVARYHQVEHQNRSLARSNAEFDAFAHTAAHDLKAPIRGIRQTTEFFLEDAGDRLRDDETEQLQSVLRLTGRMSGLLDDLMRYAQVGGGAVEVRPQSLRTAVAEALELLGAQAGEPAVEVADGTVHADASALRQLLQNLIGNACKYSDGRPEITVDLATLAEAAAIGDPPPLAAALPPDTPVLRVTDRGVGIPAEHLGRVFSLFHRIQGSRETEGSGAGLALCRRIAQRHGGDIWVTSAVGEGSTFWVALPGPA